VPKDAPYDEIADWYEHEFLGVQRARGDAGYADTIGVDRALVDLLGEGDRVCLEVGCGTGVYAERVRDLGWTPLGIDLSAGMLRHARGRLAVVRGDAGRLPVPSASLSAVIAVMVHTDMPDYAAVLAEIHRVLLPAGVFVHIGVHPCFCGGFADRSDLAAVVIGPGYQDEHWTTESHHDQGIRDKLGAQHLPLASLLNLVITAGFSIEQVAEGGEPTPITLSFRAAKAESSSSSVPRNPQRRPRRSPAVT
jgi:SAM-dependent methyltransferase